VGVWKPVLVDVGSRYETEENAGAAYFLDRLAFQSTMNTDAENVIARIIDLGGNFMCSGNRETMMYQALVFNEDVDAAMEPVKTLLLPSV
jgi:processing peptidase subunit alpha